MMVQNWNALGLDTRLAWIAEQVRADVCVIDVGTDHARLPIALLQSGKIRQAIAADVAKLPLQQAQTHIAAADLTAGITTVLSDGLQNVSLPEQVDIAICGMGGDTIIKIISAKPELKQTDCHLLLQPQTEIALLRQFLAQSGFEVVEETILEADGRVYQALVAVFTGRSYTISAVEAELGMLNLQRRSTVLLSHLKQRHALVQKWQQAKQAAGQDSQAQDTQLAAYECILKDS